MVSPLFTAFALIASGRVELPPVAPHNPPPQVRGLRPDEPGPAGRKSSRN